MKKILIALDYNPSAQKVAETGNMIAAAMQAEIALVHVITAPEYYAMEYSPITGYMGGYTAGTMDLIADINKEAENFLAATVKHLGADKITTKVLDGDTGEAIIDYSKEWNADLIILGSHSHHGLTRLFGTDVAAYVLKHSGTSVMAVLTEPGSTVNPG